jgi:hypothetical protein
MPNASVVGPFGEGDFAEEFRLDPVHRAPLSTTHAFCRAACQDWLGGFDLAQTLRQFTRALHREACTDLPGIAQDAILLISEIQSSKRALAALRAAIADDDEFLPQAAFDFQPRFLPAADIGSGSPLGNDAFESFGASMFIHLRAIHGKVLAVAEDRLV